MQQEEAVCATAMHCVLQGKGQMSPDKSTS